METMRYTERKKSSKGFIFGFLVFVLLGGTIIFLSIKSEPQPIVIGKKETNSVINEDPLIDIKDNDVVEVLNSDSIEYKITKKEYVDNSNKKIKSNMELPIISINGEELTEINSSTDKKYCDLYAGLKETMKSVENKFTYKVTYETYENTVNDKKIISIKIYQRVVDDSNKKTTTEKIEVLNIDLLTKQIAKNSEIIPELLGKEYKTIIRTCIKEYVTEKNMIDEDDFNYSYTGLENFYMQDDKIHLIFNENDLVDKKYGVLDIVIKQDKE